MPLFGKQELKLLGSFYLAEFLTGLSIIAGAYLFLYFARDLQLPFITITAIVFAAFYIGTTAFEIPSGVFADVYGRKCSVIVGTVLMIVGQCLVAFLRDPFALGVVFFMMGIGAAFRSGANEAWPVDNVLHHKKPQLVQVYQAKATALRALGGIMGPLIAAFLAQYIALRFLFIVDAAVFVLALIPLWLTHEHGHVPQQVPLRSFFKESLQVAAKASKVIFRHRVLRLLFFALTLSVVSYGAEAGWQPLFALLAMPLAWIGALSGIQSAVRALAAPFSELLTRRLAHNTVLGLLSFAHLLIVGLLLFAERGSWVWSAIAYVGIGVLALEQPIFFGLQQKFIPSQVRATVLSFYRFAFSLMGIAAMLFGGFLLDLIGPKYAILALTLFTIPEAIIYFSISEKKVSS